MQAAVLALESSWYIQINTGWMPTPAAGPRQQRRTRGCWTRRHDPKIVTMRLRWNKRLRLLLFLVVLSGFLSTGYLALHAGYVSISLIQRIRGLYRDEMSLFPIIKVDAVDCSQLFDDDALEISRADAYHKTHPKIVTGDGDIASMARDCDGFRSRLQYITTPVTIEEAEFPIAFRCVRFTCFQWTGTL